ncbi:hypothetical protein GCM10009850_047800 [Nonomuraea monospora]|uniref:Uncharacterized protein n=1 Tax=Nonomuraea monospora TaxID=568818 RepID=A0ABN3CIQ2_9ACTN
MTISTPVYCTREDVKNALDVKLTARSDAQIDRAIESASRTIEGFLHRKFHPELATRYFAWPNGQYARPWRLWLNADEVISVTSVTSGGVTVSPSDYFLEPANSGPPYNRLEIDLDSAASFAAGSTHQRSIAITGLFGFHVETQTAGTLGAGLDASGVTVNVSDSASVGVGDLLLVGEERMLVTDKTMLDTGQNLGGDLSAQAASVTVPVFTGSAFTAGETLLIGSERMLVVDIAGNNLTVKRAWDGSVLVAHSSGADIYAPRTLIVQRGVLGTTAASHSTSDTVSRHVVPALVRSLCVAEAINTLLQEGSGYARVVGSGDNQREAAGRALRDIREQAYTAFGRKARSRAV